MHVIDELSSKNALAPEVENMSSDVFLLLSPKASLCLSEEDDPSEQTALTVD